MVYKFKSKEEIKEDNEKIERVKRGFEGEESEISHVLNPQHKFCIDVPLERFRREVKTLEEEMGYNHRDAFFLVKDQYASTFER